jgi:Mrp family chromosome partitioning ATPase
VSKLQQLLQGSEQVTGEAHDSDYFRRRAAEARAAAFSKRGDEKSAVAGELALAYAALARRRAALTAAEPDVEIPAIPLEA